jgi:hypothetical protein
MALSGFASKLGLTKKKPATTAPTSTDVHSTSSVAPPTHTSSGSGGAPARGLIGPVKPSSTTTPPVASSRSTSSTSASAIAAAAHASSSGMDGKQTIEFKVAVLGGPSVGKSSLLRRYCQNQFTDTTTPTIAFDIWSHVVPLSQVTLPLLASCLSHILTHSLDIDTMQSNTIIGMGRAEWWFE